MSRLRSIPSRLAAAPARLRAAPKVAESFYQSKAWRSLVTRRKRDPDYIAALLRARGGRVILDHIDERKDGGADLDPLNTQWLTMPEHAAKTAKARAKRASGR